MKFVIGFVFIVLSPAAYAQFDPGAFAAQQAQQAAAFAAQQAAQSNGTKAGSPGSGTSQSNKQSTTPLFATMNVQRDNGRSAQFVPSTKRSSSSRGSSTASSTTWIAPSHSTVSHGSSNNNVISINNGGMGFVPPTPAYPTTGGAKSVQ